jgi:trans-AT polyketide synthase/acyltransferase/oxidoreductase domain-containing protein
VTTGADALGCATFRRDHGVRYAYVAGAMYKGIASKELVLRMASARLLSFLGTGGLALDRIESDLLFLRAQVPAGASYGINLLAGWHEDGCVDLCLKHDVTRVEAAAYLQISPALVRYRLSGLTAAGPRRKVIAKVSRPEIAEQFLSPPPERMVRDLLAAGRISDDEAARSQSIPMAEDICVEADSGGHTDQGVAFTLVPAIVAQAEAAVRQRGYAVKVRVGAAGGLGTPRAIAAAFVLGADFVLTGSVNQCTIEAGISDAVKDMLQHADVQDTAIAPAGDMFEQGSKVRVFKKGLFFPARANRLYELYRQHDSLDTIDAKTREQIETKYFKRTFDEVYAETRAYFLRVDPAEIERAERDPKHKMALIFKWYFVHSARLARAGSADQRVDYQVHCGPALGAFNQWVRGTPREDWRQRHVDDIADLLMTGAAAVLQGARLEAVR